MEKRSSPLRPWFLVIGVLLVILIVVAVGRSPLYRGFITGQLLADLSVKEVRVEQKGSLLDLTVIIERTGESIKADFLVVAAKAALVSNPEAIVWEENGAINVTANRAAPFYEVKFTVPVSFDTYEFTFDVDALRQVAEVDEKNNSYKHRVTVSL